MGRKHGFSFSYKRALGISGLRGKIARATGIPTTRSGLERKIGRMATGGGCIFMLLTIPFHAISAILQILLSLKHC